MPKHKEALREMFKDRRFMVASGGKNRQKVNTCLPVPVFLPKWIEL
ncbi:hypothetical protein A249_01270 [Pseudomonas syringae pv. actinidiae ICMP 18804]|nr:hypothetical protein A249_01270 [Pseudomonas syringae pv. actinidiae ICMP 18804]